MTWQRGVRVWPWGVVGVSLGVGVGKSVLEGRREEGRHLLVWGVTMRVVGSGGHGVATRGCRP